MDYEPTAADTANVRLLMADVGSSTYLTDEQVQGYLRLSRGSLRRAAADAVDAIATSELLVSKVIQTQSLTTDGSKVAAGLRAHADRLRAQAREDEASGWSGFELVGGVRHRRPEATGHPLDGL